MQKFDVFVPASAGVVANLKHYPELMAKTNVENKSMIPLDGKPMVAHVIETLDNSKYVRSITVLGLGAEDIGYTPKLPIEFIEGGNTSFDTIQAAIAHFQKKEDPPEYIIGVSSDIPLITTAMVDKIIERVDFSKKLELYFHISSETMTRKWYPEAVKVPIKLKHGAIFAGDFTIMRLDVTDNRKDAMKEFMRNRKNVWSVIKIISFRYIFKYIFRRLTMDDISNRFKKIFDLDAAFIYTDFPEPCMDLDYASDIELFQEWIKNKRTDIGDEDVHTIMTTEEFVKAVK